MTEPSRKRCRSLLAPVIPSLLFVLLVFHGAVSAQTFAVIDPERGEFSQRAAERLSASLSGSFDMLDPDLAFTAFRSFSLESAYNLDLLTARNIGAAVGCRFYVLVRAGVQRRSRFDRPEYYEAHAAYFLVDSVTGRLADWQFVKHEEDSPAMAEKQLLASADTAANRLSRSARRVIEERKAPDSLTMDQEAGSVRPPMPYRRLKPEYTELADLYGIEATVDAEVTITADGSVKRAEIVRWAGYGLDESVLSAIREMQWRPADRKGETLEMSVLLRYNFRDIDDESGN